MCFIFHTWGKWTSYKVQAKETLIWQDDSDVEWETLIRQRRTCTECGKMQDTLVR